MTLPNFLILGVGKAGTTSLFHYLPQHPHVSVSRVREPKFLMYAGHVRYPITGLMPRFQVTSLEEYESLYAGQEACPARMDISPSYIVFPKQTIFGIQTYVPDAKMIVIYRQPVDQAYSNFLMHVRMGDEPIRNFAEAVQAEEAGIPRIDGAPRSYLLRSYASERTAQFLTEFPKDRFLFLLYDDFVRDPDGLITSIYGFLGVDSAFHPDTKTRHNPGAWPRSPAAHALLTSRNAFKRKVAGMLRPSWRNWILSKINAVNLRSAPPLDPNLRDELTRRYREDILTLQPLIHRDLSGWLAKS